MRSKCLQNGLFDRREFNSSLCTEQIHCRFKGRKNRGTGARSGNGKGSKTDVGEEAGVLFVLEVSFVPFALGEGPGASSGDKGDGAWVRPLLGNSHA